MDKKQLILAISAKKRHGKDTAAKILTKLIPHKSVAKLAFATPVKIISAIALGLPEDEFLEDSSKDSIYSFIDGKELTGREILQRIGTEGLRSAVNTSIWITNMSNRIEKCEANVIIITDLRFPNEYDYIKSIGGVCVRVERTDYHSTDNHPSETSLDAFGFDYTISCRTGELDKMEEQIVKIIENELD